MSNSVWTVAWYRPITLMFIDGQRDLLLDSYSGGYRDREAAVRIKARGKTDLVGFVRRVGGIKMKNVVQLQINTQE